MSDPPRDPIPHEGKRSPKDIFLEAIELPADRRASFVRETCGIDSALRERVEALLKAYDEAAGFLDRSAEPSPRSPNQSDVSAPTIHRSHETVDSKGFDPGSASAAHEAREVERSGALIGRYKLLEQIGEGGFGTVWMAEQEQPVRRRVALKVIKLGMDTRQVIARFEAERQALAMMDHPNIAKVLDAGATETGRPYFVMELVRGVPITQYCDENSLTPQQRLELFVSVCQAVQHAHQKGIIHRDIKPNNVLVSRHDDRPMVKVIDFGIAKATGGRLTEKTVFTELRQMIGTPTYMSPEQAGLSDLDIDTRSDIYSLGVLLYELLTGTTPFEMKTLLKAGYAEIQRIIREVEPPTPSTRLSTLKENLPSVAAQRKTEPARLTKLVRGDLDWIVMKCLEKDRARRYETANGLAADIHRYLDGEAVVAAPPSQMYRLRKLVKRNKGLVIAATTVAAVLVLGIVGTSYGLVWALREKSKAEAASAAERRAREAEQVASEKARQQAKITEAVNDFLTNDLLSAVDPTRTPNRDITVRQVVEEASLRIGQRFQGEPVVGAAIERTLGEIYSRLDLLDKARKHLQRAQDVFRAERGEQDRSTLEVRGSLDELYFREGHYAEGIQAVEESLKFTRSALGPDDPITLTSQTRLATLYGQAGQFDRAEALFRATLDRQRKVLGPAHRETIGTLNNLAMTYMEQQRHEMAGPLLSDALTALRTTLGESDPDVMEVTLNLAWTYCELGQVDKAVEITRRTLELARQVLGNEHRITSQAINSLGVLYVRKKEFAKAEPLYREDLEASRRRLGSEHPEMCASLNNLGRLYNALKQFDKAEPLLREARATSKKVLPKGSFNIGVILHSYGQCLIGLKRPREAVPLLLEAHDIILPILKEGNPGIQLLRKDIATAYERIGDKASADAWRAKSNGPAPATSQATSAPANHAESSAVSGADKPTSASSGAP